MSRRRKKNPLLMRIILATVGVHILALPILAHYGAFQKLQRQFGPATVVLIAPPPETKIQPEKAQKKLSKQKSVAKKGAGPQAHHGPAKPNPNAPKQLAASGPPGDTASGPTVDTNGTGAAGVLPTGPSTGPPNGTGTATTTAPPSTGNAGPKPPPPITNPVPPVTAPPVTAKKAPVFVSPEPTYEPQPTIPDDLRADALDAYFVAEFMVGMDGAPSEVAIAHSTGIRELDDLALKTAKQWRFKPATKDGEPVSGRVRLRIEFKVD